MKPEKMIELLDAVRGKGLSAWHVTQMKQCIESIVQERDDLKGSYDEMSEKFYRQGKTEIGYYRREQELKNELKNKDIALKYYQERTLQAEESLKESEIKRRQTEKRLAEVSSKGVNSMCQEEPENCKRCNIWIKRDEYRQRAEQAEAQCAAMREALVVANEDLHLWHEEGERKCDGCATCEETAPKIKDALNGTAANALLERMKRHDVIVAAAQKLGAEIQDTINQCEKPEDIAKGEPILWCAWRGKITNRSWRHWRQNDV